MDINKKVLIIILLIFAFLAISIIFTHNMQLSNFLELERVDTLENVEQIQNAVATEQSYLDYIVQDWACWDDTYQFIDDRNQEYVTVNLENTTLAGINVNFMIFVNNSGEVVYVKSVNTSTAEEEPVPEELFSMIEDGSLLTKGKNDSISGFVLLDENPMFIACHPILTTKYKGPSRGTLIFGRYFDEDLLDSFRKVTHSSLIMYRADEKMPPDFQLKIKNVSENPDEIMVETLNDTQIAGYFGLKDIKGQLALLIRADFPRDFYMHVERTLYYIYVFLLLTGLMAFVSVKFAFDKLFISRLIEIDDFVTRFMSEKDLSKRLSLKNKDEIGRLSKAINGMLNEIYQAEKKLKDQALEKEILLDSLNELVVYVDLQLRIIWANKAALEYMKISLKEAVGICLTSAPVTKNSLFEYKHLEQVLVTGTKKSWEFTSKDGREWFVQAIPVTNEEGTIIGILETFMETTIYMGIKRHR